MHAILSSKYTKLPSMAAVYPLHHRLASLCAAFLLMGQSPAFALSRIFGGEPGKAIARRADESKTFEIPFNITLSYGEVYGFNCSVGSPSQNITVGIRISSSSDTQFSNITDANPWDSFYNASLSTSSKRDVLPIRYDAWSLDGSNTNNSNLYNVSFAMVSYSSDDLVLPGTNKTITLDDVPFVGWTNTTFNWFRPWRPGDPWPYQWIGLGLPVGQISRWADGFGQSKPYPTFPQRLINTGTIESNTFSVWLDEASKKTGHLLFGGLNLNRYQDSLVSLPTELVDTPEVQFGFLTQTQLGVTVDSIGLTVANSTNAIKLDAPLQVTLDHGIETRLPLALITAIAAAVGANTNPDEVPNSAYYPGVPCSFLSNTSTLDIKFSGASSLTLSVPIAHLTSRNGDGLDMSEGENAASCRLNIRAAEEGLPGSFGAGMLKNLYTVYDLDNNVISIALTDFNTTAADHLITIPSGGVSAISKDALTRPESGSATSPTSPASSSSAPVNGNTSSGGVNGMAVGLGVGIPVAAILLGISAIFLIRRRRREKRQYEAAKDTLKGNGEIDGPGELGSREIDPHMSEMHGNPVNELEGKADVMSELPVSGTVPNTSQGRHELA
ncbi:aspartic peptidase domain-containing protein [Cadophora sp. MPI-SDFR-AT-0126]|nr:aspartic peptidase domain-containing protein [Leotiomycetes sp. MPI-SDFR-AT-0126]